MTSTQFRSSPGSYTCTCNNEKALSAFYFLKNGLILTKLTLTSWEDLNKYFDFGDLDLVFKN